MKKIIPFAFLCLLAPAAPAAAVVRVVSSIQDFASIAD